MTSFSTFAETFTPNVRTITTEDIKDVNLDTLQEEPIPTYVCMGLIFLGVSLCVLMPKKSTRPILAMAEVLPKGVQRKDILANSELGQEMGIMESDANTCLKLLRLWRVKLRNDHALLAMYFRDAGTNHSTKQRVMMFIM